MLWRKSVRTQFPLGDGAIHEKLRFWHFLVHNDLHKFGLCNSTHIPRQNVSNFTFQLPFCFIRFLKFVSCWGKEPLFESSRIFGPGRGRIISKGFLPPIHEGGENWHWRITVEPESMTLRHNCLIQSNPVMNLLLKITDGSVLVLNSKIRTRDFARENSSMPRPSLVTLQICAGTSWLLSKNASSTCSPALVHIIEQT
jgi:hypothetical protein